MASTDAAAEGARHPSSARHISAAMCPSVPALSRPGAGTGWAGLPPPSAPAGPLTTEADGASVRRTMQHGSVQPSEQGKVMDLSRSGLRYRVDGNPGETIFLVHGVGSAAATWWRLRPLLAESYRVVSYDLRGHGGSSPKPGPWSIDDFVTDHLELIDELGPARSHLVGFSLGALVAMAVALRSPEAVDHLVLLNCAGGRDDDDRARVNQRLAQVKAADLADTAPASTARWFTARFRAEQPAAVQREVDIVSRTDTSMYRAAYEVLAATDLIDEAHLLKQPVLLVTGGEDAGSTPRMSEALASRMPNARVHVLPGLKHYLHIEVAQTVAELIIGFISE